MIRLCQQYQTKRMIVFLLVMGLAFSGCDTLRKKFTRQKKKSQTEDNGFVPVLEPQDYPAPENNPKLQYSQHYSLAKVWFRDLSDQMNGNPSNDQDKAIQYKLKQLNGHLDNMNALLDDVKKADIQKAREDLKYLETSLNGPKSLRNRSRIQRDLRSFYRTLKNKLSPGAVKRHYIKASANVQDNGEEEDLSTP